MSWCRYTRGVGLRVALELYGPVGTGMAWRRDVSYCEILQVTRHKIKETGTMDTKDNLHSGKKLIGWGARYYKY